MCGILGASSVFGITRFNAALKSIQHRGPDGSELLNFSEVFFGFSRLAIQEIKDGRQPLYLVEENLVALFNGEIYNYRELREALKVDGIQFYGDSEVEVLLRGYRHWGDSLASKIQGMYAIAFWDRKDNTLILIRDPLGKKPIYIYQNKELFAFASEIKALWKLLPNNGEFLDKESLVSFLVSDSVATPRSIDSRIKKVKPGTILKIVDGSSTELKFWPLLSFKSSIETYDIPSKFQSLLKASVEQRLLSEASIGIFLSSGLDSMAVASTIASAAKEKIQSFTLKFDGSYDESNLAGQIAKEFGFEHTVVKATDEDLAEIWTNAKDLMDEPLNDPAILPMMLLSRTASKSIKVAITGDGGDELFLGYPQLKLHQYKLIRSKLLASILRPFLKVWPDDGEYFGNGFRLQRLARGLGIQNTPYRDLAWRGGFKYYEIQQLLNCERFGNVMIDKILRDSIFEFTNSPIISTEDARMSWWYLRTYLMDTVLVKVDRASMAFGVECRSPLLDIKLVEFVLSLQEQGDLKKYLNKKLLQLAVSSNGFNVMPSRMKHGMGIPILRMLRTTLFNEFNELTNLDLIADQGFFKPESISELREKLKKGRQEIRKEAWAIFTFQAWLQKYGH